MLKKLILFFLFLILITNCLCNYLYEIYKDTGSTNPLKLVYIGHSGLYLTDGLNRLYIDFPYISGVYGYMEFDKSCLDSLSFNRSNYCFLFTHGHADHFNRKEIQSQKLKITGPSSIKWKTNNFLTIDEMNKAGDWKITSFKTKHTWSLEHFSYLIEWYNVKIFISGDTKNINVLNNVNDVDILITTPWFLEDVVKSDYIKKIKKIMLCHFYPNAKINNKFQDKVIVPHQGMIINMQDIVISFSDEE